MGWIGAALKYCQKRAVTSISANRDSMAGTSECMIKGTVLTWEK
jgi:hypothetical protein